MYTNAREVTHGFSKNFFPGTGYNVPVTVMFLIHLITAFVAPVFFVVIGLYLLDTRPEMMLELPYALAFFSLPATQLALAGIIRLLISRCGSECPFGMHFCSL